jgi:hypothetical protein
MTRKDQILVVDVVVIDLMQETMASNVISQPAGLTTGLSTITKIRKYLRFHEGHHFILMATKVHDTPMSFP